MKRDERIEAEKCVGRAFRGADGVVRWITHMSDRGLYHVLWLDESRGVWFQGGRWRAEAWVGGVEVAAPRIGSRIQRAGATGVITEETVGSSGGAPAAMMADITLTPAELEEIHAWLESDRLVDGTGRDDVLFSRTASFANGYQADFKVVNSESGPWSEVVLFDSEGNEISMTEPFHDFSPASPVEFTVDGVRYVAQVNTSVNPVPKLAHGVSP